jgi:hypothetical protein
MQYGTNIAAYRLIISTLRGNKMKLKTLTLCLVLLIFVGCESRNQTDGETTPSNNNQSDNGPISADEGDDNNNNNCTTFTQHLSADLISNGSFEEGHSLGNNQWNVFPSLGAWYADTTYNDAGIEIQRGDTIGGLAPSDRESKLEFDAHERNGFTASDVAVYQDVDTNESEEYILYFDYSPRVGGNTETNAAEVFWDGQLIASLNSEVIGWQTYTLRVTGAGAATRLKFKGHIDNNTTGGYLDNVHLKKIVSNEEDSAESITILQCVQ